MLLYDVFHYRNLSSKLKWKFKISQFQNCNISVIAYLTPHFPFSCSISFAPKVLSLECGRKEIQNRIPFRNQVAVKHQSFLTFYFHKVVPCVCIRRIFPNFSSILHLIVYSDVVFSGRRLLLVFFFFVFQTFWNIAVNFRCSLVHSSVASVIAYVRVCWS